jgi:hypothetical protein
MGGDNANTCRSRYSDCFDMVECRSGSGIIITPELYGTFVTSLAIHRTHPTEHKSPFLSTPWISDLSQSDPIHPVPASPGARHLPSLARYCPSYNLF